MPAAGDTLSSPPSDLVLTFSGPVEAAGSLIRLLRPGRRDLTLEARRAEGDSRSLTASLPELEPGGYRVEWRVVSADGHPVGGDFTFWVAGAPGEGLAAPPPPGRADPTEPNAEVASPFAIGVRATADVVLLALAGMLLLGTWGGTPSERTSRVMRGLTVAAPLLATVYAWQWVGEALGGQPSLEARFSGLTSLTTGRSLAVEVALTWLVAWALLLARRPRIAAVLALLAVAVGGMGGHPMSYTPLVAAPASVAHLLAASAWTGGLLFVVTERDAETFAASVRRVSSVALASVLVLAVTGVAQTLVLLGSLGQLTSTPYGLLVLAKVAGFAALVAFGAHHRFRLMPAVASAEGAVRLARSVRRELALATGVVILAAVLSHVPPSP